MLSIIFRPYRITLTAIATLLALAAPALRADWQRTDTSLAWTNGNSVVWKFSFDPRAGKPFFHPLSVDGRQSLTNFKPEDHPWHYGLWFSWKYINHVNYWEEDRATGRAEGATRWTVPSIETQTDGRATIKFTVTYTNPTGRVDITEQREIAISALATDGGYELAWHARFTAGSEDVLLDRTPMPDEPEGKFNGGYAGLALRLASAPLTFSAVSTHGALTHFEQERNRPNAAAVGFNISDGPTPVGSIAIVSHPNNAGKEAPWYIVNSAPMRFVCAAILAPKPLRYAAGNSWELSYRIILRPTPWTAETLEAASTTTTSSRPKN
jgi:hypothetical protein